MGVVFSVLNFLLWLYFVALIGRLVIEWVQVFSRDWRPRGVVLVIAEAVFTVKTTAKTPPGRTKRSTAAWC